MDLSVTYGVFAPIGGAICQRKWASGGIIRTATSTGTSYWLMFDDGPAGRECLRAEAKVIGSSAVGTLQARQFGGLL